MRVYSIINVVQATHHQNDVRYGTSSGIQCPCISLMSVTWTLFRYPGIWDKFDLDCILVKRDKLFKMEDLPQGFLVENYSVNVEFLENKTGKITAGTC